MAGRCSAQSVSQSSIEALVELLLSGATQSELDVQNLNATQLIERLNQLAQDDAGAFGLLENALLGRVEEVHALNSVEVTTCVVGRYISSATGLCTPCAAGTFSEQPQAISESVCERCAAGTYSSAVGASNRSTCVACAEGKFSSVVGANTSGVCQACGAGATSAAGAQGAGGCQCLAGYYLEGGSCLLCPEGHFCASNAKQACNGFSEGKSTSAAGSSSVEQCKCRPGWYGFAYGAHAGSGCRECPVNSFCNGDQDAGNYGKKYECPANSQSPLGSTVIEDCVCLDSYRKQYSMPAERNLAVTAEPCVCTNARSTPTCRSLDVEGCVKCLSGSDCASGQTLTCKQGHLHMMNTIPAGSRTWKIAPAGATRVRVTFSKFAASTSTNTMVVEQCMDVACSIKNRIVTLSGNPGVPKNYETDVGFSVVQLTWSSTSSTSSPVALEYTSVIPCNETVIGVASGTVRFVESGETVLYPFQPEPSWPLVVWLGDVLRFAQNAVTLELRAGSASGAVVMGEVAGVWIPESVGPYWLVDAEYPSRTRQLYVAPVDSRRVQVWYDVVAGGAGSAGASSFTLTGDVSGAGSPDILLVVRDVLSMSRLSSGHGVVLLSRYENATSWTALGGAGLVGQSLSASQLETSVTWDTAGRDPGVYYYASVGSVGGVRVGRIVLQPASGGASCAACHEGEYCYNGDALRCPANSRSPPGSSSVYDCKCSPGFAESTTDLDAYANGQTVDCGGRHTCVIDSNETLWCWGANEYGQLGLGRTSRSEASPQRVPGLSEVKNVSLGDNFTCAVVGAGKRVKCWGGNWWGQLGLDSSADVQSSPGGDARLGGGAAAYSARTLSCAGQSCCAIVEKTAGVASLTCWGRSNFGQLGKGESGAYTTRNVGTGVSTTASARYAYESTGGVVSVGAGVVFLVSMAVEHACAVTVDGEVYCWGLNGFGVVGAGSAETTRIFNPSLVDAGGPAKTVNCYAFVCCAVMRGDYRVKCWGRGWGGRLGVGVFDVGATAQSMGLNLQAVNLGPTTLVMDVNVGELQTCALLSNNFVKCWGLVRGSVVGDNPPGDVMDMLPNFELQGSRVALQIAGKGSTTCAVTSDYRLVCWGGNEWGQLGGAASVASTNMTLVALPSGVTVLESSGHSMLMVCSICRANTYCRGEGGAAESCPANTQSLVQSTQKADCACFPGYKPVGGGVDGGDGCVRCEGREYCAANQAYTCIANSATVAPGSSSIDACQCDVGFYYAGVNLGCVTCGAGSFKDAVGNSGSCTSCPGGTWSAQVGLGNASGCAACAAGTFSSAGSTACVVCSEGTAAGRGSSACAPCAAGFFAGEGAEACGACPAGTYDAEPRDGRPGTCTACPPGTSSTVLNATGDGVCGSCAAGSFSGSGASNCTACDAGRYSPAGSGSCLDCPDNATSSAGSPYAQCRCVAGFYKAIQANGVDFACAGCVGGEYAGFDTVGACSKCPGGTASAAVNAGSDAVCARCAAGRFAAEGSSACQLCGVGAFSSSSGASNCTSCRKGFFAPAGATVCGGCVAGKYSYAAIGSASQCLTCPAGSFCVGGESAATDAELVQACPLGTFQNSTGQSTRFNCRPCDANAFCPSPTLKGQCPLGTRSNASSTSQLQCVCEAGYTCNYQRVVNAVVTLFMTAEDFNMNPDVRSAFLAAVALAAKTTVDKVRIKEVRTVTSAAGGAGGARRRLLSASEGAHVLLEILDGDARGLGDVLDAHLGAAGIALQRDRAWIEPHSVVAVRRA